MRAALIPSVCENKLPRGTWTWFCSVLFLSVIESGIFLKTACFGFVNCFCWMCYTWIVQIWAWWSEQQCILNECNSAFRIQNTEPSALYFFEHHWQWFVAITKDRRWTVMAFILQCSEAVWWKESSWWLVNISIFHKEENRGEDVRNGT